VANRRRSFDLEQVRSHDLGRLAVVYALLFRRAMKGSVALLVFVSVGCQNVPEPIEPLPVPSQDRCPETFGPTAELAEGCYREIGVGNWVDAEKACEQFSSEGIEAHLVIIDREGEHEGIAANALRAGDIWTGRMQQDDNDEWRNITYVIWAASHFGSGEPNDYGCKDGSLFCEGAPGYGDERCIEYKQATGLWNDKACHRDSRVLCEWDGAQPYGWRPGG
jgi:hypothetical protein